jgi:hypothetical protein
MWLTPERKIALRQTLIWLGVTLFSVVFRIVYYAESHGVTSPYMSYVFVPAVLLALLYVLNLVLGGNLGIWVRFSLNAGTGTLIVYLALRGVYAIAQASSSWSDLFLYMALAMYALGLILLGIRIYKRPPVCVSSWF